MSQNSTRTLGSSNWIYRQIAAEFQAMEYDPANAERIKDLIYYMQQTIEELEKFLYLAK